MTRKGSQVRDLHRPPYREGSGGIRGLFHTTGCVLFRTIVLTAVLALNALPAIAIVGGDVYKDQPDLFCAARVDSVTPVHQTGLTTAEKDLGRDHEFAVVLEADTPQTLSGSVQLLSGSQPYLAQFASTTLSPFSYAIKEGQHVVRSGTMYKSAPIFVRLPRTETLQAAWLFDLAVNGKTVDCETLPFLFSDSRLPANLSLESGGPSGDDLHNAMAPAQEAVAEKPFDFSDCLHPIAWPQIASRFSVTYPPNAPLRDAYVDIRVSLDAAGHVADASVVRSSGNKDLDVSGLYAAVHSTFNPMLFLCSSVPSFYTYRAEFSVDWSIKH